MMTRLASLALLCTLLTACGDEDKGLSVATACDIYSDKIVECFSDDPLNDDNVKAAAVTTCTDEINAAEAQNEGDRDCHQAIREYYRCIGVEATCEELESEMTDDNTCLGEALDVIEFCDVPPY